MKDADGCVSLIAVFVLFIILIFSIFFLKSDEEEEVKQPPPPLPPIVQETAKVIGIQVFEGRRGGAQTIVVCEFLNGDRTRLYCDLPVIVGDDITVLNQGNNWGVVGYKKSSDPMAGGVSEVSDQFLDDLP